MNRKLLLLAGALSGMAVTASAQTVRSYVTLPDRSALYSESEEYENGSRPSRSMVSASP